MITQCVYPIVGCLNKAQDMQGMGTNLVWTPVNPVQGNFLDTYMCLGTVIDGMPEMNSAASRNVEEINSFLRRHGFSIQLQSIGPDEFAVASVLDLLVEWAERGTCTPVVTNGQEYPGVRIGRSGVMFYTVPSHPNPIAALRTKSDDVVYMTMLDDEPFSGRFNLLRMTQSLNEDMQRIHDYDGIVFPMVNLSQVVNISWITGMHTTGSDGRRAVITRAVQQNKLRINEIGARAQSAVGMTVTRESIVIPKPDHIINRPFLFWIIRPGLEVPLFAGYISMDVWSNPGDINVA